MLLKHYEVALCTWVTYYTSEFFLIEDDKMIIIDFAIIEDDKMSPPFLQKIICRS